MGFFKGLQKPRWAPQSVVSQFASYRDAVIWCWENRLNHGAGEKVDQAICANAIGLPTPQMSRCVKKDSHAPMCLPAEYLADFEAFCGWRAASLFLASRMQLTFLEQVMEERMAVAA
ncbi:hypothetical protein [Herbaspirillum sp. YR522]|uniref:hypothetical protein n=1 Tax=Herbaspirillum sp. YR522 TaxID=1144342 RepID=UPI00026FA29C|nr:hypothetical protein [Herbaspirillum sp. YR522]EJN06462.1 hypothetical protein PMI40_02248 [Herbaspirillum sp. YR522]